MPARTFNLGSPPTAARRKGRWALTLALASGVAALTGCARDLAPEDEGIRPDGFTDDLPDGFTDNPQDAGRTDRDARADWDAQADQDAARPDPDAEPPAEDATPDEPPPGDPCQGVQCGAHATCRRQGQCACDVGFVMVAGECAEVDPGDPAQRTEGEVCARWKADYGERAQVGAVGADVSVCAPGALDPTAQQDAMRRLNLFRWLAGLEPATVDAAVMERVQAAALIMDANNRLSHDPTSDWACFSQAGADGAGSSNLALGVQTAAQTVDLYIQDRGVDSLGHRRWCLFPLLDGIAFGHVGRGGAMYSFGRTNRAQPDFVAYPSPGPYPADALDGAWSFSSRQLGPDAQITVTNLSNNLPVDLQESFLQQGFGLNTASFTLATPARAGEVYRVEVTSGVRRWRYDTAIAACR